MPSADWQPGWRAEHTRIKNQPPKISSKSSLGSDVRQEDINRSMHAHQVQLPKVSRHLASATAGMRQALLLACLLGAHQVRIARTAAAGH